MNYTQHYQLPQWVETDRILMEDFNDMSLAIGAALDIHNCQIYTTSYVGTGQYGNGRNNLLTFPCPPRLVMVCGGNPSAFLLIPGAGPGALLYQGVGAVSAYRTGNTLSWFHSASAEQQLNASHQTYWVTALLDASTGAAE